MAKLDKTNYPQGSPTSLRGSIVFRETKWGLVAQAWPRPRKRQKTPAQRYDEASFGWAGHLAASPHPLDYESAVEWVRGTSLLPRDFLTMAALGLAFEIELKDGTVFTPEREMTVNAQLTLDQVTEVYGSIIFRSADGWIGLDPGDQHDVLGIDANGYPAWVVPASAAGGTITGAANVNTVGVGVFEDDDGPTLNFRGIVGDDDGFIVVSYAVTEAAIYVEPNLAAFDARYALSSSLATVATTGSYDDLTDQPTLGDLASLDALDDSAQLPAAILAGSAGFSIEEFTPTLDFDTSPTGTTYSRQDGTAICIPALGIMFVSIRITLTSKGSGGSGNAIVGTLPFVARTLSSTNFYLTLAFARLKLPTGRTQCVALAQSTSATILLRAQGDDVSNVFIDWADVANNTAFEISGIVPIASE